MELNIIYYSLIIIATFLGNIAGFFLALIAPEELRDGYKYFIAFSNIVFASTCAIIVNFYLTKYLESQMILSVFLSIVFSIAVLYLVFKKEVVKKIYVLSSVFLFLVFSNDAYLMVVSIMLFFVGVGNVSSYALKFEKKEKLIKKKQFFFEVIKKNILFIIIGLIPLLFSCL